MSIRIYRAGWIIAIAMVLLIVPSVKAQARAQFDLPSQSLATSLRAVGSQTGTNVLFDPPVVEGLHAPPLKGILTTEDAFTKLLSGSGLKCRFLDEETVMVVSAATGVAGPAQKEKSAPDRFHLAQADQGVSHNAPSKEGTQTSLDQTGGLEEVVVTAQKRQERLQDVPLSLSVVSAQSLLDTNQVRLSDWYTSVVGLSIDPTAQSTNNISIRGIVNSTSAGASPTTGVVIDDTPLGGGSTDVPDLDPSELQRIEVLRGPQGALYGSSSMGGLVKFVTVDPSVAGVTGRLEAGAFGIHNAPRAGYLVRAAGNFPVSSDAALRVSGFYRDEPGYLDNPILGVQGVNHAHADGAHLSFLWQPNERFRLKLSGLAQVVNANSTNDIMTSEAITGNTLRLGDLQQGYGRGGNYSNQEFQAYSATLTYHLGRLELSSITGYTSHMSNDSNDLSIGYLGTLSVPPFGEGGWTNPERYGYYTFSQEFRATGPLASWLTGGLGLYYAYTGNPVSDSTAWAYGTNSYTGARIYQWAQFVTPGWNDEGAVYASLDFQVTDRFDIQVGGRQSQVRQLQNTSVLSGKLFDGSVVTYNAGATERPFTYLFSPRYKFTQDLMAYIRLASGFRPGGPNNPQAVAGIGASPVIQPDKTYNYELGAKGDFLDHKISADASVYYIDWKGMQLNLAADGGFYNYGGNAGRAKSEGAELSIEVRPLEGTTLSGWVSYDEAVITEFSSNVQSFYAVPGYQLPFTPRWSGHLSADQKFSLTRDIRGSVGATLSTVGARQSLFTSDANRTILPAYTRVDLHADVSYRDWTVTAYLNNITDRRGLISGGLGNVVPVSFYIIQPRTIGLSLTRVFE